MNVQANRAAAAVGLSSSEQEDLLDIFHQRFVNRVLPRLDSLPDEREYARATLMRYFGRSQEDGRYVGAGWEADRIVRRRRRFASMYIRNGDGELVERDLVDDRPDITELLMTAVAEADELRHERERCAVHGMRVARQRRLLEEYLAQPDLKRFPNDSEALHAMADGIPFVEVARRATGLARPPKSAQNLAYRRYERAYHRIPAERRSQLHLICPEPRRKATGMRNPPGDPLGTYG